MTINILKLSKNCGAIRNDLEIVSGNSWKNIPRWCFNREQLEALEFEIVKDKNETIEELKMFKKQAQGNVQVFKNEAKCAHAEIEELKAKLLAAVHWLKENGEHNSSCSVFDINEEGKHFACDCGFEKVLSII
jgi:hypothetical protein